MKFVPESLTRKVGMSVFQLKESSPTILFAVGVTGVVGAAVLACRATLKVESVVEKAENRTAAIANDKDLSDTDKNRLRTRSMLQTAGELTVLYGPALALGAVSIASLAGSHKILKDRNASLTAAYVAVSEALAQYRKRVASEIGEEKEEELYHDVQTNKVSVPGENKKRLTRVGGPDGCSPYAKLFDNSTTQNFFVDPGYNNNFLRIQQDMANKRLRAQGVLLLNDVYEMLGFERTSAGCVVGWRWGSDKDNFVDFGLDAPRSKDFVAGFEKSVWLDFNVDGPVFRYVGADL